MKPNRCTKRVTKAAATTFRSSLFLAFPFLSLTLLPTRASGTENSLPVLEREQMKEDLEELDRELRFWHAGMFRYTSESEWTELLEETKQSLPESADLRGFFCRLARLVGQVHCGHTAVRPPNALLTHLADSRSHLPLRVRFRNRRCFVLEDGSPEALIPPGSELLAIAGHPLAEVLEQMMEIVPGDGMIEMGKIRTLESRFGMLHPLIMGPADKYLVRFRLPSGETQEHSLTGTANLDMFEEHPPRPKLSLEIDDRRSLGILEIRTFGGGAKTQEYDYEEFLAYAFTTLEEREVEHLILDLRGNSGGEDMYGALLVSYLSPEPFGYFSRIEVTDDYVGEGDIVDGPNGSRLVTNHPGCDLQYPSDPYFLGDVYLLIDGGTFSTAADVATVAHHLGLVTTVGEETGGGYDGNTSGIMRSHRLRHSNLPVGIPRYMYVTANEGHEYEGRGVIPHHPVSPSISDVLEQRDPAMARAMELIDEGSAR